MGKPGLFQSYVFEGCTNGEVGHGILHLIESANEGVRDEPDKRHIFCGVELFGRLNPRTLSSRILSEAASFGATVGERMQRRST
jgi:hypothetical protein